MPQLLNVPHGTKQRANRGHGAEQRLPPAQERQTQYFQPYAPVLHDLFLKWGLSRPASCLFPKNGRMRRYHFMFGRMNMKENILVMENIRKVYSNGFIANENVTLAVNEGEIHALVGENGAGKSTLMKVLFGVEKPDEGRILLNGEEVHIDNPNAAIKMGIGMVYQHFMLVPSLTVTENLVIGMEPRKDGIFYDSAAATKMVREAAAKYNFDLDPDAKIRDLSVGQKQKVEILKVLIRGAKIVILDEPTAVLTPQETRELFVELKGLKKQGYTVIFISHKLNEVKELCDRVTVMRAGKTIDHCNVADVTEADISRMMVGRDIVMEIDKEKNTLGETVLSVQHVTKYILGTKKILDDVSFRIRRGEILGVAGVEGNGQKEISEIITGLDRDFEGTVKATPALVDVRDCSIRQLREKGIAHISEDRMTYGIVGDGSIADNIIADRYYKPPYKQGLLLNQKAINENTDALIKEYTVKCDNREQPIRMLSGGNMQKVVTAREFTTGASLIVANQPTRGIDIGASDFIRRRLVDLRTAGAGVLLISADLNEVLEVSDSLIVMHNGRIAAYFPDASKVTEEELGEYMLGVKTMSPEEVKEVADCE